jgi:putative ABC transport system substrate-binding protein
VNNRVTIPSLPFRSDNPKSKIENLKWGGIVAIVIALAVCGAGAEAQQAGKIFRIGYLDSSTASGGRVLIDAFRQELSKLGWIEGKNITMEYRFAEQKSERLPELAAELVRLNVDLIFASAPPSALAAKNATTTIPIVLEGGDLVGLGLVASLARPGGNATGVSSLAPDLGTKRLAILKDTVPKLSRVGIFWWPGARTQQEVQLKELRPAALALKLKLDEIETEANPKSLETAFQTARQKQVDAITATAGRSFFAERKQIVELASKYKMPAIYSQREFVDEGGLMSYGADYEDLFRRSAHYVDKVLKGAKPADLPVQQATKFEFIVNLKAAKQIGLTIPIRVLERANRVIK